MGIIPDPMEERDCDSMDDRGSLDIGVVMELSSSCCESAIGLGEGLDTNKEERTHQEDRGTEELEDLVVESGNPVSINWTWCNL